jgi:isopenicillin-N epimerase
MSWSLADGVAYLNHGSFGPAPRPVLEAQTRWIAELQKNPMEFYVRRLDELLDDAAERLARFLGCHGKDLIFVPNATVGMNIVADNVSLDPGDEVLLNDHEYGAVMRIWRRRCDAAQAQILIAKVPTNTTSQDEIVDAIFARVSDRTKLIVVSHVTSPTATVFPVEAICARARQRKIPVCIDGPHAIAMRPFFLNEIGCDYYCASCHKWLSAPFGSGFLYVAGRHKSDLKPPILSWGRSLGGRPATWKDEFHWFGTYQPAAFLAIPAAIEFLHEFDLHRFRVQTHALARYARERMIQELDGEPLTPDAPAFYGSMVTMRLPWIEERSKPGVPHSIQQTLAIEHRVEAPIVQWNDAMHVRASCHLYNTEEHIDRLIVALKTIRG